MAVLLLALLPIPPKFSKSSKADQRQRKINADTLQDVFELIFAPLQDVALHGLKTNACPKCEVRTHELGPMPKTIDPEITEDTNATNLKKGTQARSPITTMS